MVTRPHTDSIAPTGLELAVMHGNGNVIAVVDVELSGLPPAVIDGDLAKTLCQSFTGPRVDGIAFLGTARGLSMIYFERDGTRSAMCGNALRCVTRYCADRGLIEETASVRTDDGQKRVTARNGQIEVALGAAREFRRLGAERYFVYTGLPHLVVLVGDLDEVDVRTQGARLRYDEELCRHLNHPEGLHVDFMRREPGRVAIRTYEVGVEDETLACGTGVAASAYVASRAWGFRFPMTVRTRGGEMTVNSGEHGLLISGVTGYLFRSTP